MHVQSNCKSEIWIFIFPPQEPFAVFTEVDGWAQPEAEIRESEIIFE